MTSLFNNLISSGDEPPSSGVLFHYTDLHGLKGIVENECLWATDIPYQNDSLEYFHALKLAKLIVANAAIPSINDDIKARLIENLEGARFYPTLAARVDAFVTCFSEEPISLEPMESLLFLRRSVHWL